MLWEFATRQRVDAAPVIVKDRVFAAAGRRTHVQSGPGHGQGTVAIRGGGGFTGSPAVASSGS